MTPLGETLSVQRVLLDVAAASAPALLDRAADTLSSTALPAASISAALAAREAQGSTGLGRGVAIPHARLAGLSAPAATVIRLQHGLDWGAPDDVPVDLYFILLVPDSASQDHLELLAEVARRFASPQFRDAARALSTPDEMQRLFVSWRAPLA